MENIEVWETPNHVPSAFKTLDGAKLNLDQCNEIYKLLALKHARSRKRKGLDHKTGETVEINILDPDYAKARDEFRKENIIKRIGNHIVWVLKGGDK